MFSQGISDLSRGFRRFFRFFSKKVQKMGRRGDFFGGCRLGSPRGTAARAGPRGPPREAARGGLRALRVLRRKAKAHRRAFGGGPGWVAWRGIQAARRETPQGAAALTLRRRHGAPFFACRGREPKARSLSRVSTCGAQGLRRKSPHACLLDRTKKRLTRDGSAAVAERSDYTLTLL